MATENWRQYGGNRKQNQFHNLTIGTLVADQVLLRESYSGKFIIPGSIYVGADVNTTGNIYSYTHTYTTFDNYVGKNLYLNKRLYFATQTQILDGDNTRAYMYGDFSANTIGINTPTPKSALDITGTNNNQTDILSVSSASPTIRNTLGQNLNKRGITLNASDNNATLGFYIDTSLNYANNPNGQIKQSAGGNMYYISTNNNINSTNNTILTASGSTFITSQTLTNITSTQSMTISTKNTNILSKVAISNRGQPTNIYNESTIIYDISNGLYLYDAYENSASKAGSALTLVATDNSSNTFLRLVTPNNAGLSITAGTYPNDQTRTISALGIADNTGKYRVNQTMVTGSQPTKYYTTTGFNTYAPRTDTYVMDINGPTHISNGEINKMAEFNFEVLKTSFSKTVTTFGITAGTPSPKVTENSVVRNPQYISYTRDGGITWTDVRVDGTGDFEQGTPKNFTVYTHDDTYAFLGSSTSALYYTKNGGLNWVNAIANDPGNNDYIRVYQTLFMNPTKINNNSRLFASLRRTRNSITEQCIFYTDLDLASLPTLPSQIPNGLPSYFLTNFTESVVNSNMTNIYNNDGVGNSLYFVGTGINKYNTTTATSQYLINTSKTYYGIHCYSSTYIVAVGAIIVSNNVTSAVITYTRDGTNWLDSTLPNSIPVAALRSIHLFDTNRGMAVGDSGLFLYTNDGAQTWSIVPNSILNSSGYASRINGSYNKLRNVYMIDTNTMAITAVKQSYAINVTNGLSKTYMCYIPNLYNRATNKILDVSGNMEISGDINVNDGGNLVTNNSTFNLINTSATTVNFANAANNIYMGNIQSGKTYLRHDFDVSGNVAMHENLVLDNDFSMNGNIQVGGTGYVGGDLSVNNRLFITQKAVFYDDIHVFGNIEHELDYKYLNRLYVEQDTYLYQRLFVGGDSSLNGNVYIGGPVSITTTITPNSNTITLSSQTPIQSSQSLEVGTSVSCGSIFPAGTIITAIPQIEPIFGHLVVNGIDQVTNQPVTGDILNGNTITLNNMPQGITVPTTRTVFYQNSKMFSVYPDTSLNSRLYVGGDTSLNGRLAITGDVSLNGNLTMYNTQSYMNLNPTAITYNYATGSNPATYNTLPLSQFQYIQTLTQSVQEILNNVTSKTGPIGIVNPVTIPTQLAFISSTSTSITIRFNPVANADHYVAYINGAPATGSGTSTSFTISGLIANNQYGITVAAYFTNNTLGGLSSPLLISTTRDFIMDTSSRDSNITDLSSNISSEINPFTLGAEAIDPTILGFIDQNLVFNTQQSADSGENRDLSTLMTFDIAGNQVLISASLIPVATNQVSLGSSQYPINAININNQNAMNFIDTNQAQGSLTFNTTTGYLDLSCNGLLGSTLLSYGGNVAIGKALPNTTLDVLGTSTFNGNITQQTGNLYLNNRLYVTSGVYINNDISLVGNMYSNKNLYQTGDALLNSRLFLIGDASLNNNLFLLKDASFNGRLFLGGDASINANLYVARNLNIIGDISLNSRLNIRGDASFNSNLYVANRTFLNNDLSINGNISLNGTAYLNSDEYLKGNLFVTGNQFLNGNLLINGQTTTNSDVSMNLRLFVARDVSFNSRLFLQGIGILNNDVYLNRNAYINNDLSLNGNLSVGGEKVIISGDTSMNGDLFVNNNLLLRGDMSLNGNLFVNSKTINNADVNMNNRLFVSNDVSMSSNLFINRNLITNIDASINRNLTIGGTTINNGDISANSRLFVNNDVSLNRNLFVKGIAVLNNDASINGNIIVNNNAIINSTAFINKNIIIGTDASINANLIVGRNTVINGSTNMIGQLTVNNINNIGSIVTTGTSTTTGNVVVGSNLSVNQNTNLNGSLTVGANTNLNGPVNIGNDLTVNGNLSANYPTGSIPLGAIYGGAGLGLGSFANDVNIGKNFYVGGDTTLYGNLTVVKNMTLIGQLIIKQYTVNQTITTVSYQFMIAEDLSLNGRLYMTGDASINGRVFIGQDVSMNANLYVAGRTTFAQPITIGNSLNINGPTVQNGQVTNNTLTIFNADASMNARLSVFGPSNFNSDVSMNSRLYVQNDTSLNGNLFIQRQAIVQGDASLNTRLFVQNDTSLNSNFYVKSQTILQGDASLNSRLFVQNDTSLNGNFYTQGKTILNGDVSMNNRLYVAKDASLGSNLYVTNLTTLNSDVSMNRRLYVQGDASLGSNLYVANRSVQVGDVSINSRLFVGGDASLNGNVYVGGKTIHQNDVSFNKMIFGVDASYTGNVAIYGNLYLQTDLKFDSLYVKQPFTAADNVYITGQSTQMVDASLNGNLNVNMDSSLNGRLYLAKDASFSGRLFVAGDVSINGNVFATTQASSDNSTKVATTAFVKTAVGALTGSSAGFTGDVSVNYRLYVGADASLQGKLFTVGDISANSRLFVGSDVSLAARLFVGGDLSVNGNVNMNGNVTAPTVASSDNSQKVATTAFVKTALNSLTGSSAAFAGDVSINYRLYVGTDTSMGGRLFVAGDVSLNGNVFATTQASSDNSTKLATTAFVKSALTSLTGSSAAFTGDVSINYRLYVGSDASMSSKLFIGGDVSMNSRLFVGSDASMGGNLRVNSMLSFAPGASIVNTTANVFQPTLLANSSYNYTAIPEGGNYYFPGQNYASTDYTGQYFFDGLHLSTDYGATSSIPSIIKTYNDAGNGLVDSFVTRTGQIMISSGFSKVFISRDYGSTWSVLLDQAVQTWWSGWFHGKVVCDSTGTYIFARSATTNSPLYVSNNSGSTWTKITSCTGPVDMSNMNNTNRGSIYCNLTGQYAIATGLNGDGGTGYGYVTSNYGVSWISVSLGASANYYGFEPWMSESGQYVWLAGNFSSNYGVSFARSPALPNGYNYYNSNTAQQFAASADASIILVFGGPSDNWIKYSTDYGATFTQVTISTTALVNNVLSGDGTYNYRSTYLGGNNPLDTYTKKAKISGVISSGLSVSTSTTVQGSSVVSQDISMGGRLFTSGDVSLNSRLYLGSDASMGGNLYTRGIIFQF